ncbi:MAG TPA: hypothetical protein PLY93_03820 [Turneriella sp.]|nr:hypothetical protein [Turneriella sp.]
MKKHWFLILRRTVLFFALAFIPIQTDAYDENGVLMGGFTLMGNDGAAEAGENPAYLVFPKNEAASSLAFRSWGESALNTSFSKLNVESSLQWLAAGDLSYALHKFMDNKLAIGASLNSVRNPTIHRFDFQASTYLPALAASITSNSSMEQLQAAASVGAAYRLTASESIGVQLKYSARFESNISKANFEKFSVRNLQEAHNDNTMHTATAGVSYLFRTSPADFSFMVGNLGYKYQSVAFTHTASGNILGSVSEAGSFNNQFLTQPEFTLGSRVRLFDAVHLFTELGAQPPIECSGSDKTYRDEAPKGVVVRSFTARFEPGFSAALGFSFVVTPTLTLFTGVRGEKNQAASTFTSVSPGEYTNKNQTVLQMVASGGAAWRWNKILLQAGVQYFYQAVDQSQSARLNNGIGTITKDSGFQIEINGLGGYFGVAFDF